MLFGPAVLPSSAPSQRHLLVRTRCDRLQSEPWKGGLNWNLLAHCICLSARRDVLYCPNGAVRVLQLVISHRTFSEGSTLQADHCECSAGCVRTYFVLWSEFCPALLWLSNTPLLVHISVQLASIAVSDFRRQGPLPLQPVAGHAVLNLCRHR